MDNRAIGIFDSGLGGLTAVKAMKKLMPEENIVYFGDTARVPYGSRSREAIKRFALSDLAFMESLNVKAILAACGTVSSVAINELKSKSGVYITGVVEAASKKASEMTKNGIVAITGTAATVRSGSYSDCLRRLDNKIKTVSKACPLFVPLVENGYISRDNTVVKNIVSDYLNEIKQSGADTVILGCTHYPLLKDAISDYLGGSVFLVDSGEAAAEELSSYISEHSIASEKKERGTIEYYVSDGIENFTSNAGVFLSEEISGKVYKTEISV